MATRKRALSSDQASMSNLFPAKPVLSKNALLILQELASSTVLLASCFKMNIAVISLLAVYVLSDREEIMLGVYDFVRAKMIQRKNLASKP
ncbi:uncharacterized protein K441DRAFT_663871 [Cenococcum geophilum 1.58]|uniref:uncharacterized protein n=1 Tax=Cenococcum geophilum 1.58 TaxID=794803 RepID=UPI00358F4B04|nr:hypothetical protein K441DRAFT_663871 [Cenococcum geophilum 1.58]